MKETLYIIGIAALALLTMGGVAASYVQLADISPITVNTNELTNLVSSSVAWLAPFLAYSPSLA